MQKSLPYDTLRDFVPITEVVKTPLVLLTGPKTGFKTVADFVAAVKGAPGKMTYGSTGRNPLHLTMEMLKSLAGLDISMAAYRGEAEIEKDLIANEIQAAILPVGISKGFVRSGQLIALAVTSEERAFSLPDVPTLKELGYTNAIAEGWQGWFAPRGTSMEIVTKIHDEAAKALTNPALRKTLVEELDYVIVGSSPAEFRRHFESEISKYAEIVRVAKVPVQQ